MGVAVGGSGAVTWRAGSSALCSEVPGTWASPAPSPIRRLSIFRKPPPTRDPVNDLLTQLRRRALFQWALAYLGGAWLILQVLDVVSEPWHLSSALLRGSQVVLATGFLLTLVLAWFHGEKGRQRMAGGELGLIAVLLAASALLVGRVGRDGEDDARTRANRATPAASIAVLPFMDLSPDRDQAYFGEGIAEEILNALSRIPELRVSARTSAFLLRDEDIATIGDRLGVATVLEGSVRKEGDRVRITAQLIDVDTESHLWSQDYDRVGGGALAVQADIARQVAGALEVTLTGGGADAVTGNAEAYDLYLRGRSQWNQRNPDAFRRALDYFQRALDVDPGYAQAYSGLADTYVLLFEYQQLPLADAVPAATAAAQRALSLDATLAEARTSPGEILAAQRRWTEAEPEYRRALEVNPGYVTGHQWYGYFLSHLARHDDAIEHLRRAKDLDPLSAIVRRDLAAALYHARRFEEALEEADECVRLALQPPWCGQMEPLRVRVLEALGRAAEADRRAAEMDRPSGITALDLVFDRARLAARLGRAPEARQRLDETRALVQAWLPTGDSPTLHALVAEVHAALGDPESALDELEKAMDLGFATGPILLREWPAFDPLRDQPRFRAILERMDYP